MVRKIIRICREEILAPRPTPKLEDHSLSAVQDYSFDIFAATLPIEGRSSVGNLRMRHAKVTPEFIDKDCTMIL